MGESLSRYAPFRAPAILPTSGALPPSPSVLSPPLAPSPARPAPATVLAPNPLDSSLTSFRAWISRSSSVPGIFGGDSGGSDVLFSRCSSSARPLFAEGFTVNASLISDFAATSCCCELDPRLCRSHWRSTSTNGSVILSGESAPPAEGEGPKRARGQR